MLLVWISASHANESGLFTRLSAQIENTCLQWLVHLKGSEETDSATGSDGKGIALTPE